MSHEQNPVSLNKLTSTPMTGREGSSLPLPQFPTMASSRPTTGESQRLPSTAVSDQQHQHEGVKSLPVFEFTANSTDEHDHDYDHDHSYDPTTSHLGDVYEAAVATTELTPTDMNQTPEGQERRRRHHRKSFSGFSTGIRHGVHGLANAARRLSTNIRSKHSQTQTHLHASAHSQGGATGRGASRNGPQSRDEPRASPSAAAEIHVDSAVGIVGSSAEPMSPARMGRQAPGIHPSPLSNSPRTPESAALEGNAACEEENHYRQEQHQFAPSASVLNSPSLMVDSAAASVRQTPQPSQASTPAAALTALSSPGPSASSSRMGTNGDSKIFGSSSGNGYLSVGKQGWGQDCESGIYMGSDIERVDEGVEEDTYNYTTQDKGKDVEVVRKDPLTYLPYEVSAHILAFLDAESLKNAELVSRSWHSQASSRHVWREVFRRQYHFHQQPQKHAMKTGTLSQIMPLGLGRTRPNQDWKKMYSVRHTLESRWKEGKAAAIYLHGHTDSVYCVQFDEDKIITGSRDRTIRVWNARFPWNCLKVIGSPEDVRANASAMLSQAQNGNGHGHHGNNNNNNNNNGGAPPNHIPPTTVVVNPSSSPGGKTPFMSLCPPSKNANTNPEIVNPERAGDFFHTASILCLQFDDEIMVTGSSDSTCIVWDIKNDYRPIRRLQGHSAGVLDICFDDRYIISCSKDTMICVWDRKTGNLIKKLMGHHGPVNAVQLRGDCVVSASGDGIAKLWNLTSGLCIKEFTSRNRGLACVEFSENARIILAGGNDQVIYEFDANTGELITEMHGHTTLVRSLHLDSANKRIVSGSYDMSVRVFDAETGELSINLPNWTTSWILSAKSDYRRIVATSQDARAVIMDFGYGLDGIELLEE